MLEALGFFDRNQTMCCTQAKLGDLAQREQMLKQQLEMLQTENARLTRQAALLDSRLRLQAEQLHEQIASLDLFHYGPCLPEFNGDYSQPKMCDHSISLPAPPDLIEAHKDITYEQVCCSAIMFVCIPQQHHNTDKHANLNS